MSAPNTSGSTENEEHKVPIWMLSPSEEKTLLKEHQVWAEKQCEKQYDGKINTNIRFILIFRLIRFFLEFALCCKEFRWTFPWKCNVPKQALMDCVAVKGSPAMFQKLRDEYIDRKIAAKKEAEAEAESK